MTKTPYRVSMFGGGTDHPSWFKDHGGSVVSFSIDKFCLLSLDVLAKNEVYNYRVEYSKIEIVERILEIQHPAVRHAFNKYGRNFRLSLKHNGDLPARSGVGSSSAFAVGLIKALFILNNLQINALDLAEAAIEFEQAELQEVVGSQDQIACALGGINFIDFYGDKYWDAKSIKLSNKYKEDLESRMVLMYSGISRNSSDVSKSLLTGLSSKTQVLLRVQKLAVEFNDILSKELNLDLVTDLMLENWSLKKNSNPAAITIELEKFYEHARKNGALAGKILGAGGGGFFLFWVKQDFKEQFVSKMSPLQHVPFKISYEGCKQVL